MLVYQRVAPNSTHIGASSSRKPEGRLGPERSKKLQRLPCGPSYVCGAINPMNTVRSCWAATINHSQPPPPPFLWDISLGPTVDQARSGRLVFGIVKSTPHVSSVQAIPLSFHWILVGLEWAFPFLDDFYPQWLLGSELIPELTINQHGFGSAGATCSHRMSWSNPWPMLH